LKDKLDAVNTSSLITRLKVLAQLKIDENKKPQD
jgi:type II secretory ATPase GspE/PulE/Tfp pilus assembly ATPase PilB-like protein